MPVSNDARLPPVPEHLKQIAEWFLGPQGQNREIYEKYIHEILDENFGWRRDYQISDRGVIADGHIRSEWHLSLDTCLSELTNNLKRDFPFFSPRYLAHMLSEQTIPSFLGYVATLLYNPNNVTREAAPVTVRYELESAALIAEMLGFPSQAWAHLCSGGTVAQIEALWVARSVQLFPLIVKEFVQQPRWQRSLSTLEVLVPNGRRARLTDLTPAELVSLTPSASLDLMGQVASPSSSTPEMSHAFTQHLKESQYNIRCKGLHSVCAAANVFPVIVVSKAQHYCIEKAASLLGYGEDAIVPVPVDNKFRLRVDLLADRLDDVLRKGGFATVIAMIGTTEEGAVDPVHEIQKLRQECRIQHSADFWMHIDAAWGGYFASILRPKEPSASLTVDDVEAAAKEAIDSLNVRDQVSIPLPGEQYAQEPIGWDDTDVIQSLLCIREADSVIVDPHKMGYVPYPAGAVVFRDRRARSLVQQKASYIFSRDTTPVAPGRESESGEVGSFSIEGSKPGAAAAACWLAHKTIPLNAGGHGLLIRECALNAQRLVLYLSYHRHVFRQLDAQLFKGQAARYPFTFFPLYKPDLNVVCFVARPMTWVQGSLVRPDVEVAEINQLNDGLKRLLRLHEDDGSMDLSNHYRDFFAASTVLSPEAYGADDISDLLSQIGVNQAQYREQGLIVLRSTVMNPFYSYGRVKGRDWLWKFVEHLHKITRPLVEKAATETLGQRQR